MNKNQYSGRLSDQLRQLIDRSGVSRYRLSQAAGIDQAMLSRFMAGKGGLGMKSIDALAAELNVGLTASCSPQIHD